MKPRVKDAMETKSSSQLVMTLESIEAYANEHFKAEFQSIPQPGTVQCEPVHAKDVPENLLKNSTSPVFRILVGTCLECRIPEQTYVYLGQKNTNGLTWARIIRSCEVHSNGETRFASWIELAKYVFEPTGNRDAAWDFLVPLAAYYFLAKGYIKAMTLANDSKFLPNLRAACARYHCVPSSPKLHDTRSSHSGIASKHKCEQSSEQQQTRIGKRKPSAPKLSPSTKKRRVVVSSLNLSQTQPEPTAEPTPLRLKYTQPSDDAERQNDLPMDDENDAREKTPDIDELENFARAYKRLKTDNQKLKTQASEIADMKKTIDELRAKELDTAVKLAEGTKMQKLIEDMRYERGKTAFKLAEHEQKRKEAEEKVKHLENVQKEKSELQEEKSDLQEKKKLLEIQVKILNGDLENIKKKFSDYKRKITELGMEM